MTKRKGAISSAEMKRRLLRDPATKREYERLGPEFELASALIGARKRANLTQIQLAKKMGTNQAAIARLESGRQMPRTNTLERFATATGTRLKIEFVEP